MKGETVVVTGASGGVGIHAVQLAKAMGARVIAVTRSEDKASFIRRFADDVIVASKFSNAVKSLTDGVEMRGKIKFLEEDLKYELLCD